MSPTVDDPTSALDAALDAWVADKDSFVPAIEAGKFAAFLRESNPDLLSAWLDERADHLIAYQLSQRLSRARARARSPRTRFAEAAAEGDVSSFSDVFAATYRVDEEDTQKRLSEMTGADHRFVAEQYQLSGQRDLMLAAVHKAAAKKVGRKRTAEVFTEEQWVALFGEHVAA